MNDFADRGYQGAPQGEGPGDQGHNHGRRESEYEARFGELSDELRLLAEAVLERVEPVLRRAAADGRAEWGGCSWCPVCAAAALVRGEHHDVVSAIADHGTSIVTVLREALAGVPVEPLLPDDDPDHDDPDHAVPQDDPAPGTEGAAAPSGPPPRPPGAESAGGARSADGRKRRYVPIPVQIKA